MGQAFKDMCKKECIIKYKFITTPNPQANSIIERVHQVIANLCQTFELEENYMDTDDPWAGLLTAATFTICSTIHTTLKVTPGQLVFGCNLILNIKHEANWNAIKEREEKLIHCINKRENLARIQHEYSLGEKILLEKEANKYERANECPYKVMEVFDIGTVMIYKGDVTERINIQRLIPFFEQT